jgi:hypothetical protein
MSAHAPWKRIVPPLVNRCQAVLSRMRRSEKKETQVFRVPREYLPFMRDSCFNLTRLLTEATTGLHNFAATKRL